MFNTSSLVCVITLISLIVSSSGVMVPFGRDKDVDIHTDILPDVSGTRQGNGNEVNVLLINASSESAPILNGIISANATYNLTEEGEGETTSGTWGNYDILVWGQGRENRNVSLETELREYVLAGGHLFIEGANIADQAGSTDFENDVLHASSIDGIPTPDSHYVGQNLTKNSGDHPITDNPTILADPITYISNDTHGLDSDVCFPENGSEVALEWDNITTVNGTTNDNSNNYGGVIAFDDDSNLSNGGQIVFASFAVPVIENLTHRSDLVENIMHWLIPSELDEYYSFYMSPDSQDSTTNSGGTVVYDIQVANNGTLDDTIDLVRSAPPPGWTANLNQTTAEVEAGKNTSVSLTVTAPVSAQNGDYANISVTGTSQGNIELNHTVYTNTTVNNEARADLEPIDLGPTNGQMVLGQDTRIASLVRNNGDRDADNVLVAFYLDDNTTAPIGTDTIDVPAGEETEAFIDWNATDSFGDHTLLVEVDPYQNHPETDETNNNLENDTRDWIVLGMVDWTDDAFNVTGNLIISGLLQLDNITILFNSTDGTYGIDLRNPGTMDAVHSTFGPLGGDTDSTFRFQVRDELSLTDSRVHGLFYNENLGDPRGGIEIFTSTVHILNTTITDSGMGIWTSVSPTIENSTFEDLDDFGVYSNSGSPIIRGTHFESTTTAIVLKGGTGSVANCEITDVSTGIWAAQNTSAVITGNYIHDLNGLSRGVFITDSSPTIEYNEIHDTLSGIWLEGEESSPFIAGNDLSSNIQYSAYSKDASPIFERNDISENEKFGFYINGGMATIRHTQILDNVRRGIYAYQADITVDNVTLNGNDNDDFDEGIYASSSMIRLFNTTFDSYSFDLDMNLTKSSTLRSFDSDFENVNRTEGSVIAMGWFLNIEATDRGYDPIADADVTIHDVHGTLVFQSTTDENGMVNGIPLISYNETDDGTEWFTPFKVDIDYQGGNGKAYVELNESESIEVIVNTPPVAVLTANKYEGSSETIFKFDGEDSSDDTLPIASFLFDFGDGESTGWISSGYDIEHIYEFAGDFTATLIVKDRDDAVSEPASVEITINNDPNVNLPDSMVGKQFVNLSFSADVYDPDAWDNLHYDWDFGDGFTSELISPSHAYEEMGNYIVVLRVTDDHGGLGEDLMDVEIVLNQRPVADAGNDMNVTFNNGATVHFTSDSYDPDDDPLTYLWDFDDGTTSQQKDPNHFYKEPGSYNVTLTVEDDSGASGSVVILVNVIEYRITFPHEPSIEGQQDQNPRTTIILQNNGSHPVLINLTTEEDTWLTFNLENMTLEPGKSKSMFITVMIPKNAPMGITQQFLIAETGGEEFYGSILIDVKKQAGVDLSIGSPSSKSGNPGDTVDYNLKLTNTGSDEDSFSIQVSSFPPGWSVLINELISHTVNNVSPDKYVFVIVSITIPQGEKEGRQDVTITASSVSDPGTTASIDIRTTVNDGGSGNGAESSNNTTLIAGGLLVVFLIIGGIMLSRRKQDMRYAEDEYDGEDSGDFDSWDDEEESKPREMKKKTGESAKVKPRILKCPKCATLLEVPSAKRPITIQCPGCGARAHIKK